MGALHISALHTQENTVSIQLPSPKCRRYQRLVKLFPCLLSFVPSEVDAGVWVEQAYPQFSTQVCKDPIIIK